jgi:uncharacterized protein YkwD
LKKTLKNLVNHTFIAGKHNSYRPHFARKHGLLVFLLLASFINYSVYTTSNKILGEKTDISVNNIVQSINQTRSSYKLPPLTTDVRLNKAAEMKAKDIINKQYWGHKSPSGKMSWAYIKDSNYEYVEAGENLAKDFSASNIVVDAWVNSPKHRENLLSNKYKDLGVAVVDGELNGKDSQIIVTLYATQRGQEIAGANSDNKVSLISGLILDKLGFYTNPISPVIILFFSLVGFYSLLTFLVHIKIKKSKQENKLQKAKNTNIIKFTLVVTVIISVNLAILYLT